MKHKLMNIAMDKFIFFVAFFLVHQTTSEDVIYKLDAEDFYRMPPKNHLDRFEPCVGRIGGIYCTAHADLVADEPNELLHMIRAYSAHHEKHFNYSEITYGLCIKKTCKQFYTGDDSQEALTVTSEACLNDTLTREYGLKARVTRLYCVHQGQKTTPDTLDKVVAVVVVAILMMNVLGSLYDYFIRDKTKPGNAILTVFALRPNWLRMVAPPSTDPRQVQLRPINGVRVMTSILVILGHVPISSVISVENPSWFESAYRILPYHLLYQGHLITLTFFVISGFLLTYNLQILAEKQELNWRILPKAVLVRWLRLTPASLIMLLLTATWLRFAGIGPLWHEAVIREFTDCRKYWLYNALYVNNLIDHSQCNLQMWSLASDMQLHIIGLTTVLLAPTRRARYSIMAALYVVGVLWPAYHIYTKDLDGSLLGTASTIATFFLSSDAFNYVYKRTYSNLPCFVIGMIFGEYVYNLQKKNLIQGDHTKWRFVYWAVVPIMVSLVLSAYFLFFLDAPRASMLTRLLFAPIIKPLFGIFVMCIIIGAMFKVETVFRGVLEWNMWVPLSRIGYCMYVVHVGIVRYLGGIKQTLSYQSFFHVLQEYSGTVIITILFAMMMHLLVEAPFAGLVKLATSPYKPAKTASSETNGVNGHAIKSHATNGHATNGIATNGHAANGLKKD